MRTIVASFALALALSSCGNGPMGTDSGPPPTGDSGPPSTTFPNCPDPAVYATTGTAITITGFSYTPPCLEVIAGTTVSFDASTLHPLTRSTAGTAGSPIPASSTTPQMVMFPSEGFFPFFCSVHGSETGGMYGVIHVVAGP